MVGWDDDSFELMITLEDSDGEIQVSDLSTTPDKPTKNKRKVEFCLSSMIGNQLLVFSWSPFGQKLYWY